MSTESLIKNLYGLTETQARAAVYRRGGDAILEKYPDIQGCIIDDVAKIVLDATVEVEADDAMWAFMTLAGWW
jgi:hypothetical protein